MSCLDQLPLDGAGVPSDAERPYVGVHIGESGSR
jgi:hypothetical protein